MGKIRGAFYSGAQGFGQLEAGAPAQDFHRRHGPRYFNFAYFCMSCGLEELRLVLLIKTDWSVICPLCC